MVEGLELVVGDDESFQGVEYFDDRRNFDELAVASVQNCEEEGGSACFAGVEEARRELTEQPSELVHTFPCFWRPQIVAGDVEPGQSAPGLANESE